MGLKKIVVLKRGKDYYHASVEGSPLISAGSISPLAAVGSLIASHKDEFGISEIKYPGMKRFISPRRTSHFFGERR